MLYFDVLWNYLDQRTPIRFVTELDDQRWEGRKVEFFPDGSCGVAGPGLQTKNTFLGQVPWPPLAEIQSQAEFTIREITKEDFEGIWLAVVARSIP